MTPLRDTYTKKVRPSLLKTFELRNPLAAPRITKVVLNAGLSKALTDKKYIDIVVSTLQRITGQKPILTKAKKSISNFRIREGMVVGAVVTLRGDRMYDFLYKLIAVAFPRTRDFHGLDPRRGFDGNGNYSVGIREHIVFPEIASDEVENIHGLEISVSTTGNNREQVFTLLKELGFPFKATE